MERNELARAVARDLSTREIARLFDCSQTTIVYWLNKHGLKTAHTLPKKVRRCKRCNVKLEVNKRHNTFCSRHCYLEYQYETYIGRWLEGKESGTIGSKSPEPSGHVRRYLHEIYDSSCQRCGWSEMNPVTGLVPLQIHHIDGDYVNGEFSNLELLCPNCHALTPTFGRLNSENEGRKKTKRRKNL